MKIFVFFLKFLLISLCSVSSAASKKISYKVCVQLSSEINSSFPITVNKNVVLSSSYCTGIGRTPSLHYLYNTNYTNVPQGEDSRMRNTFCTNEQTKVLLKILDSVYLHYLGASGKEITVIQISERNCG